MEKVMAVVKKMALGMVEKMALGKVKKMALVKMRLPFSGCVLFHYKRIDSR